MIWHVELYEPGIDPGGYHGVFKVEADNEPDAVLKAYELAHQAFPYNEGLSVYRMTEVEAA